MLKDEIRTWMSSAVPQRDGTKIRFRAEFWKPEQGSTQPAHFSVTADVFDPWGPVPCGAIAPRLDDLIDPPERVRVLAEVGRWHLCDVRGGPMHYVANGAYWWLHHLAELGTLPRLPPGDGWTVDYYAPDTYRRQSAWDCFASTVVYGAVEERPLPATEVRGAWTPLLDFRRTCTAAARRHAAIDARRRVRAIYREVEAEIGAWLTERHARLMAAFEADMVRFWGREVVDGT